jgi:hypothetical protein
MPKAEESRCQGSKTSDEQYRPWAAAQDIDAIAAAWRGWAAHADGWIGVLHGGPLIRVP